MDKIQRKNVNLRNTLLALYNLPQEARIRTVYQAMGIDIDREENSRCMVAWAVRGVVPDAVAAALHRDFPELAEAVLAGTLVIDGIERPARQEPSSALEREPKITALPRQAGKSVFDAMALLSDGVNKHLSVGIDEAFRQRLNKKLGAIELNAFLAQRQLKGRGKEWARRALYSISLLRGELAALREDIKDVSNG